MLWCGRARNIPLTAYVEAALNFDFFRVRTEWETLKWWHFTPGLGLGMDAAVWRGLSVGGYGGFGYSVYAEGLERRGPAGPEHEGFFAGEVRLTLLYAFGSDA